MKAKAETNVVAGAKEEPAGVKDTALTTEKPKASVLAPHKERLAGHFQSVKVLVRSKKFLMVAGIVLLLLVVLFAVPLTRYKTLGLFVKRDLSIAVKDTTTQRPVSGATVIIDGKSFVTNKEGIAELRGIRVGDHAVTITKKYYKDFKSETVVTLQKGRTVDFRVEATGRQVPVVVKNKIGGAPVSDALIKSGDSDTRTDKDGMAVIVVPAGGDEVKAKLTANGYNDADVTIKITESAVPENTFSVTPSGKVYFLSKQSGKIDVVKTNLDGSNRETVLAGTGREESYNTVLLASRDWKYLALLSKRDSDKSKLYLIETESGKLTTMDEGNAVFNPSGWSGHTFVYSLTRENVKEWEPKKQAIKSFNADSKQLATLSESGAEAAPARYTQWSYTNQTFNNITVFEDAVIFTANWWYGGTVYFLPYFSKNIDIVSVRPDGKDYKVLKSLPRYDQNRVIEFGYLDVRLYAPKEIVFNYPNVRVNTSQFFEYEDGAVKEAKDITLEEFNKPYPTYLLSPSGNNTLWSDSRDGKNVLFVGNKDAKDEKTIASFAELTPYGWYSDDYVLVSKKGSELYIMPKTGAKDESGTLKVSDYHRPGRSFEGYGGGYGGL